MGCSSRIKSINASGRVIGPTICQGECDGLGGGGETGGVAPHESSIGVRGMGEDIMCV